MKKNILSYQKFCHQRWILIALILSITGCASFSKKLTITDLSKSFTPNTIISSKLGKSVSFETLLPDLLSVRIVYVGEQHTNPADHAIQLKILEALYKKEPHLTVGMEMFDRTYQPVLDDWSAGKLNTQQFIEKVQWYANWKYDFDLYKDILNYIKNHHIRLIALNIPQNIPDKIAVGGIGNLQPRDKAFLPKIIDTSNAAHKSYIKKIFKLHHIKGMDNFNYFYQAQCVWDDTMAQTIADNLNGNPMIVFSGNGHIIQKFGIPERTYKINHAAYRTAMPLSAGTEADLNAADYIWATSP